MVGEGPGQCLYEETAYIIKHCQPETVHVNIVSFTRR